MQPLSSAASTGLSVVSNIASYRLPLVLRANALQQKTTYTLRLTATQNGATGTHHMSTSILHQFSREGCLNGRGLFPLSVAGVSTLTFLTNAPPTSGSLVLSPAVGVALVDIFTFEASSWVDDSSDYPLAYSFYYVVVCSSTKTWPNDLNRGAKGNAPHWHS